MENCVTSADAYPLSFQLFVEKSDGSYEAVTEKKSEPSINGIGKPKLDSSDTRTYLMNVRIFSSNKILDHNLITNRFFLEGGVGKVAEKIKARKVRRRSTCQTYIRTGECISLHGTTDLVRYTCDTFKYIGILAQTYIAVK